MDFDNMDQDEAMFGSEVKISTPKAEKSKKNIKITKWFALGLGGIFGLSHIGLIGMISRKDNLPIISPPVGPYTSYKVSVTDEGYAISYKANDPKTAFITKDIKEKGGFLGLANEKTQITEEYFMDGQINQGGAVSNHRSWMDQPPGLTTKHCYPTSSNPTNNGNISDARSNTGTNTCPNNSACTFRRSDCFNTGFTFSCSTYLICLFLCQTWWLIHPRSRI